LVDFEVKMKQIKDKNEDNLKKQAEKEARHNQEVAEQRLQQ
jgi:hypothetical protein